MAKEGKRHSIFGDVIAIVGLGVIAYGFQFSTVVASLVALVGFSFTVFSQDIGRMIFRR
ncbi:hypothetical protein [Levilactobacillus tongjiangensis]|uniref:Uncharacterized protein n=1 Tax=Levilactobacillus tongjiangensis TaxID=2486023 RepID=A0ABW1SQF1_9LACO|nr:hypothetical protein [Levilactobacillus tongjiangensis]